MKAIHFLILASVLVLGGCASEPKVAKTNPSINKEIDFIT